MPSVLIIGAGPSGLSLSRRLSDLGIDYSLADSFGAAGGAYTKMYSHIQLSSPPRSMALPGDCLVSDRPYLSAGEYAGYLQHYAAKNGIRPIMRRLVTLQRRGASYLAGFSDGTSTEHSVVAVCTGSFDNPNMPNIPGITERNPSKKSVSFEHAGHWKGPDSCLGKRVLIVGDGFSAVEIAEECARSGIHANVSVKAPTSFRLNPATILGMNPRLFIYPLMKWVPIWFFREQCQSGWYHTPIDRGFRRFLRQNLLAVRPAIDSASGNRIRFVDGSISEFDLVVFATGYKFTFPSLPDHVLKDMQKPGNLKNGESALWPGLHVLGLTCLLGINSHFVFGITSDSAVVAASIARYIRQ